MATRPRSSLSLMKFSVVLAAAVGLLFISGICAAKIGETCSDVINCDSGLSCSPCGADSSSKRCTRVKPLDPQSKVKGLPFNKYSWLTTHNSFALAGQRSATGAQIIAPTNQEDTVTAQLNNGVRGLMLDFYDFMGDVWLCHSFGGTCYNFTAFQPAANVLKEIGSFLEKNPAEIITIFIEDYVKKPRGLTDVFAAAGLTKFLFPASGMPKNGADWPRVNDMIAQNARLVVFTSNPTKEAAEGIAYTWRYVVENQYGDRGMVQGACPNRAESPVMKSLAQSLVLVNHFPTLANSIESCVDNSAPLISTLRACYSQSEKRWANFLAVDFYKRSDGGGAPAAVDVANGGLTCGCESIELCKANATFGSCYSTPAPSPVNVAPEATLPPPSMAGAAPPLLSWRRAIASVVLISTLSIVIGGAF